MIKIIAKNTIKVDQIDQFIAVARELAAQSRQEAGCISYQLFQDRSDPRILTFDEDWASQEAIDLHNQSTHFQAAIPALVACQEKNVEVNIYTLAV